MTAREVKRKLVAILSADAKGYSRLMSEDEEATTRTAAFGQAYRLAGQYQEAITQYVKALRIAPDHVFAHLLLALTYSLWERAEGARVEAEEVLRIHPQFSLEWFAKATQFESQAQINRYIEGLRKGGLK